MIDLIVQPLSIFANHSSKSAISYLCEVKKAFIYILLPVFIFNNSLGEVFKLPKFIAHFSEHYAADNSLDVFDFIYMHYVGDDLNTSDQDKDMELPFKKMEDPFSFQVVFFPFSTVIRSNKFEAIDSYLFVLFRKDRFKNPSLKSLFRPPIFNCF